MTIRSLVAAFCATLMMTAGFAGIASAAHATGPAVSATEFYAELCAGTTESNPKEATVWDDVENVSLPGPVPDLTRVWGPRLDSYNDGNVVPLYDVWGENNLNGYPPVCGVRYVEGVGPVSEWMYCTDYFAHVCSGVDEDGNLVDIDGDQLPDMEESDTANEKLTPDQEKIIVYLVTHGWTRYIGSGGEGDFGFATSAQPLGDSFQRSALQVLVWCVSDPVADPVPNGSEQLRKETCENSLDANDQAAILATYGPAPELSATGPTATLKVGETARFTVSANAAAGPITISTTGPAGSLTVTSGSATLMGNQLLLTEAPATQTVVLGFTATEVGTVALSAEATPAATESIGWNQSPGVAADEKPCQIFATFRKDQSEVLRADASAIFAVASTGAGANVSANANGNRIANTGADSPAFGMTVAALAALVVGAGLLVGTRRKAKSST